MRLLYITPGFPAHEQDENCIPPLQFLVKNMLRRGVSVDVIALDYPFHQQPYSWMGARVFPCGGGNRRFWRFITIFRAIKRCTELLKQEKYDYLHAFWLTSAFKLVKSLGEFMKMKWYVTAMGQDVVHQSNVLAKMGSGLEAHLIVLSQFHQSELVRVTGFEAKHIIPWGYLEEEIPKNLPENRPLDVLGVGALLTVKNFTTWILTIAEIKHSFPNIRAGICGTGPELSLLKNLVASLHLTENVTFFGELPRHQVLEKMRQSKVFLHTSHFESFGMVIVEGLANGCQVVSTPVGIAQEIQSVAIATGYENLAYKTIEILKKLPPAQPIVPLKFNDTGWKYWDLYHAD